jgi:8-oxo-dGTP diphosphatase
MNTRLSSERLVIRVPRREDAGSLTKLLNNSSVVEYLSHVPFPYREEDAIAFIDSANGVGDLPVGDAFVIEAGNAVIGCIGVRAQELPDGTVAGEVGYWIGRENWGHGYATEAVDMLLPYCFDSLALDRVTASVDANNLASQRVLEKTGFRPTGMVEAWMPARDSARQSVMVVLDAEQWKAVRNKSLPIVTVVAVALLDGDDRVLVAQRPEGKSMAGLWEFPGGKLAHGESPEAGLIRELDEELGINTEQSCLAPFCFASHRYETFHLLMPLFVCRVWEGQPRGREGQALKWVTPGDLAALEMPAADVPLIAMLRDFL